MRIKSPPYIGPYGIGMGRVGSHDGMRHNSYFVSCIGWYLTSYSACGNKYFGVTYYMRPRFTQLYYGMDKNIKVGRRYIGRIHNTVKG